MTGAPLPYGDEQQVPPELLAMLGGAPPIGAPAESPPSGGDPVEMVLQIMRDALSPLDENEEAQIAGIVAKFRQLIAAQAKEADAALGVSPAQKFMRRQAVNGA